MNANESGEFELSDQAILNKRGFIALEIESPVDEVLEICLQGKNVHDVKYQFAVQKGLHHYRLQVSSDVLWYSGKLSQLKLITGDVEIKNAYFEEITGTL